ncbi:energy transducer TonB [Methylotenera versatilis]|uniref:energy transducer TonB n=1 Tax=Methylotenera versatilis TaxID=1055487 RepID=UPI0006463EAB|nr:energy transducer TonB [Methylotenera versatilis]
MSSQTSTVVNLLAARHAKLRQQYESDIADEHSKLNRLYALPIQASQLSDSASPQKPHSWAATIFVVLAHASVIYLLITQSLPEKVQTPPAKPMMVSLIAPPAPEPELVPVIEPPKPEVKPVVKPKKVVEKIKPIETPTERLIEAATEQPVVEEAPATPVEPVKVAEAPKAPPVVEKVVEEKIEPPRFGVSYLNNPAPDYPPTSRRLGEEGRVLMKVLVSADGSAENVQIEKSSGSERLDNAAVNAVKRWRFIPAKKNNQALSAYVIVPVKFSLDS